MRSVCAALVCLAASACSVAPPPGNYAPPRIDTAYPRLGKEVEALTGRDMIRDGVATMTQGVRLTSAGRLGGYPLSAGFYPRIGQDEEYTYHGYRRTPSSEGLGHIALVKDVLGKWATAPDALRVSRDGSEACLVFAGKGRNFCSGDIALERSSRVYLSSSDLQRKLMYMGMADNKIRILYWENSGHKARPEAAEAFSFPGETPSTVDVHGAQIRIHRADDKAISYTVLRTFPVYWNRTAARSGS